MQIQLMSDLHTEFWRMTKADVENTLLDMLQTDQTLVLAGDISTGRTNVLKVLNMLAPHVKNIIYVPGNHEYYGGLSLDGFNEQFADKLLKNVHFLNPGKVTIDGITFVGATLWTNFRENVVIEKTAERYIQDFRRARTTTEVMKTIHYEHWNYIKNNIDGKTIVVTHFLPTVECIAEKWRHGDIVTDHLNGYFANDLGDELRKLKDVTWLFGHTHDQIDVNVGSTRCLANPLGYPGERKDYKPLVLEI